MRARLRFFLSNLDLLQTIYQAFYEQDSNSNSSYRLSSFSKAGLKLELEFHIIEFAMSRARAKIEPRIFYTSRAQAQKISKRAKLKHGASDSIRFVCTLALTLNWCVQNSI